MKNKNENVQKVKYAFKKSALSIIPLILFVVMKNCIHFLNFDILYKSDFIPLYLIITPAYLVIVNCWDNKRILSFIISYFRILCFHMPVLLYILYENERTAKHFDKGYGITIFLVKSDFVLLTLIWLIFSITRILIVKYGNCNSTK